MSAHVVDPQRSVVSCRTAGKRPLLKRVTTKLAMTTDVDLTNPILACLRPTTRCSRVSRRPPATAVCAAPVRTLLYYR